MSQQRGHWGSKAGFILAAAGSAIGLGNIWKFPYITGENGGGAFVVVYLGCIALIALPILIGEIIMGKTTQQSAVPAFRELSKPVSPWMSVGWMGVLAAFLLLSYYAVIAGWTMHYVWLALQGTFAGQDAEGIQAVFGQAASSPGVNLMWLIAFMALTTIIVAGGIKGGIELASRIMLPLLGLILLALMIVAATSAKGGFSQAADFVFSFRTDQLTADGVLEAVGHAFFSVGVGMGTMIAYGSYLRRKSDAVGTSCLIVGLDTLIALMACMVLFPITFAYGLEPNAGPGLVFMNMPLALMALPGGSFWAIIFFVLLFVAALTSAISLLEVATSYVIDELKWSRVKAAIIGGILITLVGIPSALSNGDGWFNEGFAGITGKNWLDSVDYLVSNIMLPLGGLGIALFVGWRMSKTLRKDSYGEGSALAATYGAWLFLIQWLAPAAVLIVFLNAVGILDLGIFVEPGDTPAEVEAAPDLVDPADVNQQ